jgi:subtilisin-like proprotein convertase family protein
MKTSILLSGLMLMAATVAQATLYTFDYTSGFANSGVIPDANPGGWSDTRSLSGFGTDNYITDVNVYLEITGGFNGDLYGYLVHDSGFTVLLNRVGTGSGSEPQFTYGFSTAGFADVTLDQSAGTSIHDVLDPSSGGPYRPDSGTQNSGGLNAFNGLNPNGTWTLFLADLSGGETSTLVSWGLEIEAVPEPTTWALVGFGFIFLGVGTVRVIRARRLACVHCPAGK